MEWSDLVINGRELSHLKQDDNSNQCVPCCVGMIAKNGNYWGDNDGALIEYAARKMRQQNPLVGAGLNDQQLIDEHGVMPNSVEPYLFSYGWNVEIYQAAAGLPALVAAVNGMNEYDACILACGVDAFHAMMVIKLNGRIYMMNPAADEGMERYGIYQAYDFAANNVVEDNGGQVRFLDSTRGNDSYNRAVDACYMIRSQYKVATVCKWLKRRFE